MEESHHLRLPFIMPSQAQKHVTHNEALQILDAVVQLSVLDRDLSAPPGSPAEGDRFIVAADATGAWSGHDGRIAAWQDGAWILLLPRDGWLAWIVDEGRFAVHSAGQWTDVEASLDNLQELQLLGIGTEADATNPFAAKLNKALWTARSVGEGGDGDLRYTLNKETAGDTLSLLMQTGYSGRAEFGLVGDDNLRLKVSPDGTTWTTAMTVAAATGTATFAAGSAGAPGVGVGSGTSGLHSVSGDLDFSTGGAWRGRLSAHGLSLGDTAFSADYPLHIERTGAQPVRIQMRSEGACAITAYRWAGSSTLGPLYVIAKGRGSIASPALPIQNDQLGEFSFYPISGAGAAFGPSVRLRSYIRAASPSTSDAEGSFEIALSPAGSATPATVAEFQHATGFSLYGSVAINGSRHFRRRQYAAGSLPSQASGDEIGSSDIVAAPLVSDGTDWLSPGVKRLRAVTANTTVSLPAGWTISAIHFAETAGNAVTGGIRIGTTSGATDVVAAQAISANGLGTISDAALLRRIFSRSATQTLFIQAVTAWNSASVEFSLALRKAF